MVSLQWRHNDRDGVSNHRRFDCLLNRLLIFKFVTFVFAYKQLHLCWVYFIYGLTRAIGLSFTLLLLRIMFYGSMFFFKYCYDTRYQLKGVCSNHKICVHVLVITSSLVLCSSDHVTSAHHIITSTNGTFSALLALCAGKSPVYGEFPHKGQRRRALMLSLICASTNAWKNNRDAGDLRRHRTHHDVTAMSSHEIYAHEMPFRSRIKFNLIRIK